MAYQHMTTGDGSLFYWIPPEGEQDGWWCYSSIVSVNGIEWPEKIVQACQFCGTIVEKGSCPNCQNPAPIKEGTIGIARITLEAVLPDGLFLFDPPSAFILNYARDGRRDYVENWDFRIAFSTKSVCNRKIISPLPLCADDMTILTIVVEIEADVSMERRRM